MMLSFHSQGVVLSRIIEFIRSAITLLQTSEKDFSISGTTPERLGALPFFTQ